MGCQFRFWVCLQSKGVWALGGIRLKCIRLKCIGYLAWQFMFQWVQIKWVSVFGFVQGFKVVSGIWVVYRGFWALEFGGLRGQVQGEFRALGGLIIIRLWFGLRVKCWVVSGLCRAQVLGLNLVLGLPGPIRNNNNNKNIMV